MLISSAVPLASDYRLQITSSPYLARACHSSRSQDALNRDYSRNSDTTNSSFATECSFCLSLSQVHYTSLSFPSFLSQFLLIFLQPTPSLTNPFTPSQLPKSSSETHHFPTSTSYLPLTSLFSRARLTAPITAPHESTTATLHAMKAAGLRGAKRWRRRSTIWRGGAQFVRLNAGESKVFG